MSGSLDPIDARLLNLMQQEIPLVDRPFAEIGSRLSLPEDEVLRRLAELRQGPRAVIRQISAIFDSKSLGYQSTLVAARIAEGCLDEAAAIINQHPGVSHNYRRNHSFNLWYTLAVPPDSRFGLQRTVEVLHRLSGAQATRMMPTLRLFKIGVSLDVSGEGDAIARSGGPRFTEASRSAAQAITDADKPMIRVLQQDLPLTSRPFDSWAVQAGVSLDQLLNAARNYLSDGRMRRFAAVLRHREAGFAANAMGVWAVSPEKQEQFGATAATFSAVSHCYLRPTYEDWPYNIFTMVHGTSAKECEAVLVAISRATGVQDYSSLYSTHEYKKVRVKYFTGDVEAWEDTQELTGK